MGKWEEVKGFLIKNVTLSLSKGYHVMVRQAHHDKKIEKIGSGLAITQILSLFSLLPLPIRRAAFPGCSQGVHPPSVPPVKGGK